MPSDDRLLLPVRDAARRLGLGRDLVGRLVRTGDLPSVKVGARRLVPTSALQQWIEFQLSNSHVEP
jgi:excisionase family DNA binding protein